ncbi:MAG: aminoacyl-tRNA hydrolase [Gammaproteobacteria bacterium]|nr:aminoacyl-tRNA hydrolase [Gammaproteobacteria bacterium]MDH5727434.1 aminoacyl-tRNA hydrolase [Gammaproteobacteria bacterium]
MFSGIKLIVGLGNPGQEYDRTRHNAGFWFLDEVARDCGVSLKPDAKTKADLATASIAGEQVRLLKPMTFMNRSGFSVATLARFYKIQVEEILVAHDELDFEAGKARLKKGGGHGGHNGLRDIIAQLGNQKDFLRLRIGIGHPGVSHLVSNYVLNKAPQAEQQLIENSLLDCARVVPMLVQGELQNAMHRLHSD